MKKLAPDHKTIADFRKDNADCIKPVFKEFVYLCRSLDLYDAQLVAIDGTKFKAVNSRNNNFNEKTLALRLKKTEEKIAQYLKEMDENDKADSCRDEGAKTEKLKEKISKLEEKKLSYEQAQNQIKTTGEKEVSLTDPDSRLMRVGSQKLDVCYNVRRWMRGSILSSIMTSRILLLTITNSPKELLKQNRRLVLTSWRTKPDELFELVGMCFGSKEREWRVCHEFLAEHRLQQLYWSRV